ncbi:MAG: ribosomal RNA small subunit methyltransferase A [Deltaproteobacteria bacterium]|nr:ribosomal RNA small subunit methyltransferase A [Deltaproteobacteria bacterium]
MSSVRKMVAQYDFHPAKRLGQCFLEDLNIVRRIVDLAEPAGDETVVEIGAGLGFMTEELAKRAGRLIALEVDPRLVEILRERFFGQDRVAVVQADVLKYDFFSARPDERIKVVGNIPYHISTPILFRLLEFRQSISSMLLMMQRELADRITAQPGTKEYGIPSVLVARYTQAESLMTVAPTCFYPVPDVVSSVLRITPVEPSDPLDETLFSRIVRAAFAQRRKTLRNNLRNLGLPENYADTLLSASGIDPNRRAETLSVGEFSLLTKVWSETGADKWL